MYVFAENSSSRSGNLFVARHHRKEQPAHSTPPARLYLLLQLLASRIVCRSVYDYVTGLLPLPLLLMLFMLDGGKSDQNPEPEMRWMGMRMRMRGEGDDCRARFVRWVVWTEPKPRYRIFLYFPSINVIVCKFTSF